MTGEWADPMSIEDEQNLILLTCAPLDHAKAVKFVSHPEAGAISTFIGTTRNHFHGRPVSELAYEGYVAMACRQLAHIIETMRENWPSVQRVVMMHRLGIVHIEESSVIIAVSSAHRQAAMDATAFGIDTLKARVPIWKLERYGDELEGDNKEKWKENIEWSTRRKVMTNEANTNDYNT